MSPIHVILAVDQRCVVGCAVSIRSALEHLGEGIAVRFHVVTNRIADGDREAIRRTVTEAGRDAEVSFREFDPAPVRHLARSKLISHTAYARLFLGSLVPPPASRCIYLDCDLMVERDLTELWETELDGLVLGAVDNSKWEDSGTHQRRLGLREPRYFNSGVLLVDLDRWREIDLERRALSLASRIGDRLVLHDQDALNAALDGDWLPLDQHWNVWTIDPELGDDSEAVFHFMGAPKPWHADYRGRFRARFFEYVDRTGFSGTRPWNPVGAGYLMARLRRRMPYLPAIPRMIRARLQGRGEVGERS
jgi:lipopolysaccharide biosynthesis glycosyltransferase